LQHLLKNLVNLKVKISAFFSSRFYVFALILYKLMGALVFFFS